MQLAVKGMDTLMGEAKRRRKLNPNYGLGGVRPRKKPQITPEIIHTGDIQLKKLPLTIESLTDYDLTIIDCNFQGINPDFIHLNFEHLRDEVIGFCCKSYSYGRKAYLKPLMRNQVNLERLKNEVGNQQGVLFIYYDYELSELCTFFWVKAVDCERQVKMALGDYVGSWIGNLVQESAKQASINNFPILTYSPISQINDEAPATFFLANLDKE